MAATTTERVKRWAQRNPDTNRRRRRLEAANRRKRERRLARLVTEAVEEGTSE